MAKVVVFLFISRISVAIEVGPILHLFTGQMYLCLAFESPNAFDDIEIVAHSKITAKYI